MPEKPDFIWLFSSASGRVGRTVYFLGGFLIAIIQAFPLYRARMAPEGSPESETWFFVFAIVVLATLWPNIVLTVKRLHDFGKPGIAALLMFVPIVQIATFLVLCLYPGQPGPNRYGRRTDAPAEP